MYRQYSFRSIATMRNSNPSSFIQGMTKPFILKTAKQ